MNNWKQEFDKLVEFNHGNGDILLRTEVFYDKEKLKDFIENLLEEQRKDLINQILSESPEDKVVTEKDYVYKQIEAEHFNQCNAQWRELLTNKLK